MSAGAQFHEEIANTWTEGYQSGSFLRRLQLFQGLIRSSVAAGTSWLDLGCGSGVLTQEILQCQPARIIAVDGSRSMLEHAKETLGQRVSGTRMDWHLADVSALPFIDSECLDGVLCSSVIEYLVDPTDSLKEMRRTLRPGGRLLISAPISTSVVRRAQKLVRACGRLMGKDLYRYLEVSRFDIPRRGATALLGPHGFRVVEQHYFDPFLSPVAQGILDPALLVVVAEAQ